MQGQEYAQERGWKCMEAKSGRTWTSVDFVLHTQLGLGAPERDQLKSANSGGSTADRKGKKVEAERSDRKEKMTKS